VAIVAVACIFSPTRGFCQPRPESQTHEIFHLNGLESHLSSKIKGLKHVIPRVCSVLECGQLTIAPHSQTV